MVRTLYLIQILLGTHFLYLYCCSDSLANPRSNSSRRMKTSGTTTPLAEFDPFTYLLDNPLANYPAMTVEAFLLLSKVLEVAMRA